MTNVIFFTFYYGVIFPAGFLFAAATLIVHYFTDKFCVLRVWAQAPEEGTQISLVCRSFIIIGLLIYVIMSAYTIAAFPYDNACGMCITLSYSDLLKTALSHKMLLACRGVECNSA
jgi:hypothetical protein